VVRPPNALTRTPNRIEERSALPFSLAFAFKLRRAKGPFWCTAQDKIFSVKKVIQGEVRTRSDREAPFFMPT
jgi:hypothetical protein